MAVTVPANGNIPDPVKVDSRTVGDALHDLFKARRRFRAEIIGDRSTGKTTSLAYVARAAAQTWRIDIGRFAFLAPTKSQARILKRLAADLAVEPGVHLWDVFDLENPSGAVAEVAYWNSPRHPRVWWRVVQYGIEEYIARILKVENMTPDSPGHFKFVRMKRKEIRATLYWLQHVHLIGREPIEEYAEAIATGRHLPNLDQVLDFDIFWTAWKRRERLVEPADVLTGELYPITDCPLVLLDDANELGPRALAAVGRLFPRAALVQTAAVAMLPDAHRTLHLTGPHIAHILAGGPDVIDDPLAR